MVTGTVTGPSKVPIPGAKVTLAAADGSRQSVTADKWGHYSFPSVEPATYTLSAEAAGYQAMTRPGVRVTGGTLTTVDLLLSPAGPTGPNQALPASQQPTYYDDTQLKASAVKSTTEAAGYSSQAQSPQRLLREGPSLAGNMPRPREPGSPNAAEVERGLQEALRADPSSFEKNHQLGEYYLSAGEARSGIPYLEKAQELKPGDCANGYDLAVAYLETKRLTKAQLLLQDLIRRKDSAELHNLFGEVDEALGDPTSAVNEFQLAARMNPAEKYIFDWGNELLLHRGYEPAVKVFTSGVERYSQSAMLHVGLGVAFYSLGFYDDAAKALCRATDLAPSDPRPYLFLGRMFDISLRQADEVTKRLKRFAETQPKNALASYYYAMSLWKGQRGQSAQVNMNEIASLLKRSTALDPKFPDPHLQLGILYAGEQRYADAIGEYQQAIKLKPDLADAHYRLAQAYSHTGKKVLANREFELYERFHQQQMAEDERRRKEAGQPIFDVQVNPQAP
jgi:tetratricopeptide (TPR) repeat protein